MNNNENNDTTPIFIRLTYSSDQFSLIFNFLFVEFCVVDDTWTNICVQFIELNAKQAYICIPVTWKSDKTFFLVCSVVK